MSFSSPSERQSHAAGDNATPSRENGKRVSPFNSHGYGTGDQKRMCFDRAEDQGDPSYSADTRSLGARSPSSSAIKLSPSRCHSWSRNNWLDDSSISSQNGYDVGTSMNKILCEDFVSREASVDNITDARNGSLHAFPNIEIIDAESDPALNRSFMANTSIEHYNADSVDNKITGSVSLQGPFVGNEDTIIKVEESAMLPPENTSSAPPLNTCFGVILLAFKSSLKVGRPYSNVSVKMNAHGEMLKLSMSDSATYAGIVEAPALCALLQYPNIVLKSTLSVVKMDDKTTKRTSSDSATYQFSDCVLRVLIYGQKSDKSSVGKLLSEGEFYLQHPLREEVGALSYDNPHFLLRPGFEMPSLEQLAIMSEAESDDSSTLLDEASISLVMRVFDSETAMNGPLPTEASNRLQAKLKDHQYQALAMMQEKECGIVENAKFPSLWQSFTNEDGTIKFRNAVTGTVENVPKLFYGGVLADEMGLGKTLTMLSLICWSLDQQAQGDDMQASKSTGTTLVVTPKSTINGWQEQINRHIKPNRIKYTTFHGASRASLSKLRQCNIILTTYETLRSDWTTKKVLFSHQWDRIVLDEAHHIRSSASQISKAACELQAIHRWCLSGTPICNSLNDFGSLLAFIGVQPFADRKAFKSWILDPIKEKRPGNLNRLESLVRATCLRRKKFYNALQLDLTNKMERIHWIDLSVDDKELYDFFKLRAARLAVDVSLQRSSSKRLSQKNDTNILSLINILRRICDHGKNLLPSLALDIWNHRNNYLFAPEQLQTLLTTCDLCERKTYLDSSNMSGCEHIICTTCMANNDLELRDDSAYCPKCATEISSNTGYTFVVEPKSSIQPSTKLLALIQNLKDEQGTNSAKSDIDLPAKSLIFSAWTKMLDLVQHHLEKSGFVIARIDGRCSLQQRSQAIKRFNADPSCTVMLASIGSAGEGIDLTAANNVHLLEPHWNPMQEAQAIDRVHRIGQQREVHIVRYLTRNSIETYVQWVQQEKIRLINQTLDSVHISQAEIDEKRWQRLQKYIGSFVTDS